MQLDCTCVYQTSSTLRSSPGEGQTLLRAEDGSAFVESDDVAAAAAEEIETDGQYLVCEILPAGGGGFNIA